MNEWLRARLPSSKNILFVQAFKEYISKYICNLKAQHTEKYVYHCPLNINLT